MKCKNQDGHQICKNPECRKVTYALYYGLCKECFDKWPERFNAEPDAKKKRSNPFQKGKNNTRGHFVVDTGVGFFSTKKKELVPFAEATVFAWENSALDIADECGGDVFELSVSDDGLLYVGESE